MFKVEKKGKSQMKSRNKIRVFRMILRDGPISRTDIEKKLKLSAPSVSRIVENLLKENLVKEIGKEETYVGRKPIHLIANKDASYIIGIHIAKSKINICMTNLGLEIIYEENRNVTHIDRADHLLDELNDMIQCSLKQTAIDKEKLLGIGIASRGILDYATGVIYNLKKGIKEIPIRSYLNENYNCEIMIENNINTELIAEYLTTNKLSAKKINLLYIYLGEGAGGSIICNNQLVRGKYNLAGKIGHMLVEPDGEVCYCGKKGHLEAYCAKSAIEQAYKIKNNNASDLDLISICKNANDNERICVELLDRVLDKLAIAINNLFVIINPDTIVLSGEIFDYYKNALEILREKVTDLIFNNKLNDVRWIIRSKEGLKIEYSATALIMDKVFNV